MPNNDFLVRWEGEITVADDGTSATTRTLRFGGAHDDGMRITVNGQSVFDRWNSATWTPEYGTSSGEITLTEGAPVPITVEYVDSGGGAFVGLMAQEPSTGAEFQIPGSWLTPKNPPQASLPQGWSFATPLAAGGLVAARATADVITFRTASGGYCCAFVREGLNGDTYKPVGGGSGQLQRDDDGKITLTMPGGIVYAFRADGQLSSATTPADSQNPAGLTGSYGTVAGMPRLTALNDPVSERSVEFIYGGQSACNVVGSFHAPPDGMLCEIHYWDGSQTKLHYNSSGLLVRITEPGEVRSDFAYGSNGLLSDLRSPLAAQAVAASLFADDGNVRTQIAYMNGARPAVSSITLPRPETGMPRPQTSFTYGTVPNSTNLRANVTVTEGPHPNGYTRQVDHTTGGRVIADRGTDGLTSTTTYDALDRPVSVVDPAGLRTNTAYDTFGRVTDVWGPAPSGWFSGTGAPTSHTGETPHNHQAYDEGLQGLDQVWWDNASQVGSPDLRLFDTDAQGRVDFDWGSSAPTGLGVTDNFSGRLTGFVNIPTAGRWDFRFLRNGKVRLYIGELASVLNPSPDEEELIIDQWSHSSDDADGDPITLDAGWHRIAIDYADTTGAAGLHFKWATKDAEGNWNPFTLVPGNALAPGYGNVTTSVGADLVTTTSEYARPELGQLTSSVVDPSGLNLDVQADYEGITSGHYRRLQSTTSPSGQTVTREYYGRTEDRSNPCNTNSSDHANQAGLLKTITEPDPDGAGGAPARVEEMVYDAAGAVIAEKINNGGWTCTTSDEQGRPLTVTVPAFNNQPGRTITYGYNAFNDPRISSVTEGGRTSYVRVDLLGRTFASADVWGNVTVNFYDQAGRLTSSFGRQGLADEYSISNTYDTLGRLATMSYDGKPIAVPSYDSLSRLTSVSYPSGTGNAGNGTRLDHITYDANSGRPLEVQWNDASNVLMTSNTRTYNIAGDVVDESFDGVDPYTAGANYTYDGMGRLTGARVPGHTIAYDFGTNDDCDAEFDANAYWAGQNTNRTSTTDNGNEIQWCYDHADRLIGSIVGTSVNDAITYDDHGNTTGFGNHTLTYDSSDRHIATTNGSNTVTYTRDSAGSIIERQVTGQNPEPLVRYGAGAAGTSLTMDNQNAVIETTIGLPGGASVTINGANQTWSYPNLSGSTAATANATGVKQGATRTYDPDGKALAGIPDNHTGSFDGGWMGAVGTEHTTGFMQLVEMGARVYSPQVGRFLQVDPVRGGSANDYDYASGDPVNNMDVSGTESIYAMRSYGALHIDHARYLYSMKSAQIPGWHPSYMSSFKRSVLVGTAYLVRQWRAVGAYVHRTWLGIAAAADLYVRDTWIVAVWASLKGKQDRALEDASLVSAFWAAPEPKTSDLRVAGKDAFSYTVDTGYTLVEFVHDAAACGAGSLAASYWGPGLLAQAEIPVGPIATRVGGCAAGVGAGRLGLPADFQFTPDGY